MMVPSIDLEKQFFMWIKPFVKLRKKMAKIGAVIVLLKYSEGLDAGMLLWCGRSHIQGIDVVVPTSLHILETVSNHLLW